MVRCIAFEGFQCICAGPLQDVVGEIKAVVDRGPRAPVLIFDAVTSRPLEVDFRGTLDAVLERLAALEVTTQATTGTLESGPPESGPSGDMAAKPPRGPGRPKLGVVAREVTLLPRHWEWLGSQPGGASVALRKLVEHARREGQAEDQRREAQESAYRFLHALAGNLPDFEEVTRALFASQLSRFVELTESWPADVRNHARHLALAALLDYSPGDSASPPVSGSMH